MHRIRRVYKEAMGSRGMPRPKRTRLIEQVFSIEYFGLSRFLLPIRL